MPLSTYLTAIGVKPEPAAELNVVGQLLSAEYKLCLSSMGTYITPTYDATTLVLNNPLLNGLHIKLSEYKGPDIITGMCKGFNPYIQLVATGLKTLPTPIYPPASTVALLPPAISTIIQQQTLASVAIRFPGQPLPTWPSPGGKEQPFFLAIATFIYNIYLEP